jgi:DNA polymerase-1
MLKKKYTQRLVVLDMHAILHRAYHALPDFASKNGEPTGALYGLVAMLLKIFNELSPNYIAATYDLPKPTYRHEVYEDYKAGRAKTDEELVLQIIRSKDIIRALNIPQYEMEGFEADDLIGTIVEQTKKEKGLQVVIASGDMDTMQLIEDEKVLVYTLRKGIKDTILYDEKAIIERFSFGPEQLPDYKGLRGDPSDNIIGIKGIGEKTATTLITIFGSLEDIYSALEKDKEDFTKKSGLTKRIIGLLEDNKEEAVFSKMLAEIRRDAPIEFLLPTTEWKESVDTEKMIELFSELSFRTLTERAKEFFHIEEVEQAEAVQEKEQEINSRELKETALALWLLESDTTNPTLEDIVVYAQKETFKEARTYIFSELKKEGLEGVFENIEKPIISLVEKMGEVGVLLDTAYLKKLSTEYHKELERYEKQIWEYAGHTFNINSPKQLGEVLFDELGLKPKNQKKTTTGQRSTRESELEKLKGEHPIIESILEYREIQKLVSTYIDTLQHQVGKDKRLHPEFLQAGTTTGRMASQNPNVQNIPIKSDRGKVIRNAFIAEKGYTLVALDYSQIELRLAAILSEDIKLIETFKKGEDIHARVASEMFAVAQDEVTSEMRRKAKIINFGILYGMGTNALSKGLGVSRGEAQKYLTEYFNRFSGLREYIESTKGGVRKIGYTETLFGRRRKLPGIVSKVPYVRAEAERMAINAPIQGTQADMIKIAMAEVDTLLQKKKIQKDARLVLQIHDELVYEIKDELVESIVPEIEKIMVGTLSEEKTHGVPIVVDVAVGENFGELEKITQNS